MTAADERYAERRRLEAENQLLRIQRENDRLKSEAQSSTILDGVSALFRGTGSLFVTSENGGWRIRFDHGGLPDVEPGQCAHCGEHRPITSPTEA